MVPRAAPAPLLTSSVFLQREEANVTERAGFRRSAKNRNGMDDIRKASATFAAPCARMVGRQCSSASRGGGDEA